VIADLRILFELQLEDLGNLNLKMELFHEFQPFYLLDLEQNLSLDHLVDSHFRHIPLDLSSLEDWLSIRFLQLFLLHQL